MNSCSGQVAVLRVIYRYAISRLTPDDPKLVLPDTISSHKYSAKMKEQAVGTAVWRGNGKVLSQNTVAMHFQDLLCCNFSIYPVKFRNQ